MDAEGKHFAAALGEGVVDREIDWRGRLHRFSGVGSCAGDGHSVDGGGGGGGGGGIGGGGVSSGVSGGGGGGGGSGG